MAAAIESLQNDLARAHATEDGLRVQTREQLDVQARRLAELERQLATRHAREDEVDLLRKQKASVEEELSAARGAVTRLNAEVEARGAAAAALTARAEDAERTVALQHTTLRESELTITTHASKLEAAEKERTEQSDVIRSLISAAAELKESREWFEGEAGHLRAALQEAARRHEVAMAEAEATLRKHREAGDFSHALQARLSSLQSKVGRCRLTV